MTFIALPWFVLVTTGSPARTSFVMAAAAAGLSLCGIPGGWVANRLGARRFMVMSNVARAPLIALVPFLYETGELRFWMLTAIAFAVEAPSAPYDAAQAAILAELVADDEPLLGRAMALFQAASRATNLIGPALAGVLIAIVGASKILWIDAGTYVFAFALTILIPAAARAAPETDDLEHLFAGARFLFRDAFLRLWIPLLTLWEGAASALIVLFPVIAYRRYDANPHVAGGLLAAMGAGAIVGSGIAYRIVPLFPPVRLGAAASLGQSLPFWVLAFRVPAVGAVAAIAVSGVFQPIAAAPTFSYITLRIPSALRSTALAALMTITLSANPIAVALVGPLVIWTGLGVTVGVLVSVLTVVCIVYVLAMPRVAGERGRLSGAAAADQPS